MFYFVIKKINKVVHRYFEVEGLLTLSWILLFGKRIINIRWFVTVIIPEVYLYTKVLNNIGCG
jgi:hypothetical protein